MSNRDSRGLSRRGFLKGGVITAAGAAIGGMQAKSTRSLAPLLGAAAVLLGALGFVNDPVGVYGIAAFYFVYHVVLVRLEARLQDRIEGAARATVTSVAGLGVELTAMSYFAIWAGGGVVLIASIAALIALALPRLLREAEALTTRPAG
jgi:hypothetical protein